MCTQVRQGICLLALSLTTLSDKLDVTSCKYDFISSKVIIYVRNIDVAEAALKRSSRYGKIKYDECVTIEEENNETN